MQLGSRQLGQKTLGGSGNSSPTVSSSSATPLPLFNPPMGPSYDLPRDHELPQRTYQSDAGYTKTMPRGLRPRMASLQLTWQSANRATYDYVLSFWRQFNGGVGPFLYAPPRDFESPTGHGPTLGVVAGASSAAADYWCRYSYYNSTTGQESEPSQSVRGLRVAGELLTVTVPPIPIGVEWIRFYVGTSEGSETLQATLNTRTWTEPLTGLLAGASPPSSSNLRPRLTWIRNGPVRERVIGPERWALELNFQEAGL